MNGAANKHWVLVDIGNSSIKFGMVAPAPAEATTHVRERILGSTLRVETRAGSLAELAAWLEPAPLIWFIASVNGAGSSRLQQWLAEHRPRETVHWVQRNQIPISSNVDFPDRVGIDRLLAAYAVNGLRPAERAAIIINSGTAITVDLVSAQGLFCGGAIFPGLELMARALHERTDALPLVTLNEGAVPPLPGKNTEAAMRGALYWGVRGALAEIVRQLQPQAGGAAEVFLSNLDPANYAGPARVERFLVLRGLLGVARELGHD